MKLGLNGNPPAGILLIDKPTGMTSHDVVNQVRRKTGVRRVGHAGTLDPLATGLLIILVGREFTKKQSQFLELLLSFDRTRPPLKQLDGIISPLNPHRCSHLRAMPISSGRR